MPSTHDKNDEKTWDTPDIDKWKVKSAAPSVTYFLSCSLISQIDQFKPEDNAAGPFAEESSFGVMFPKYRETYLREAWPLVTRSLGKKFIVGELDLPNGTMTVRTTRKTYDPAAILNARDMIKLLARSVPAPQAVKILDDDDCFADGENASEAILMIKKNTIHFTD